MGSCHCSAADREFDRRTAEGDLRRFRRRGPDPRTRLLLAAVREAPLPHDPTLLDIGGGIGVIHHQLLEAGFAHATQIDASSAYLAVAAAEAQRLGHQERVTFQHADFHAVTADVTPADVVTLDRVVCCDPDYVGLLGGAADHARRVLAYSYPKPRWYVRAVIAIENAWNALRRRAFRAYVHSPAAMTAVLEARGLRRRWARETWVWAVERFERDGLDGE